MNFKTTKLLLILITSSLIMLSSCKKEEEKDITVEVTNVYSGAFTSSGLVSTSYEVTVSKVDATTVKITPEDSNGTSFEVSIKLDGNGAVVDNSKVVTFTTKNGTKSLSYTRNGEVFSGTKK